MPQHLQAPPPTNRDYSNKHKPRNSSAIVFTPFHGQGTNPNAGSPTMGVPKKKHPCRETRNEAPQYQNHPQFPPLSDISTSMASSATFLLGLT